MAGIVLASGSTAVELSDDLHRYVDHILDQAVPTLRPAMEQLIGEALAEVKEAWPDENTRERFEHDKRQAISKAIAARHEARKAGRRVKEISFWDFMPYQYPPPGYRSTGRSKAAWRVEIRLESGPTLVAAILNDTKKGGAPYPYMAKLPPPESNKTYLKKVAIPAIKDREQPLVDTMSAEMARLIGGD
jgi:hypothetical protein